MTENSIHNKKIKKYKVGSLFAGIGGICLAFKQASVADKSEEQANYELAWANEIDKYACETYRHNFTHDLIEGNIEHVLHPELADEDKSEYYRMMNQRITKEKIDVLTGGFPCQAFSIAGSQKGFSDERGNLFWSIIELIKQLDKYHEKPRVLFLENVKNLKGHDYGKTYRTIKTELSDLGYTVTEQVLNTMDFSHLPQNRDRIYIIGFLQKEDANRFDVFDNLEKHKVTAHKRDREEKIKEILNYTSQVEDKYYYTKDKYPQYFSDCTSKSNANILKGIEEGFSLENINLDREVSEIYQFYQMRRGMYVRKNKKSVCPTLTANMGTGGHNVPLIRDHKGVRKLTPEETLRLQGFPNDYAIPKIINQKNYADGYIYKQAGNSVSVPVVKFLAQEILKNLVATDNGEKINRYRQLSLCEAMC